MSLSETIMAALRERAQMKAEGMSGEDLDKAFEQVVRDCWPFTREWRFNCTACNDSGWEISECPGDNRCGPSTWRPGTHLPCPQRPRKEHAAHSYVRVCFCDAGQQLKSAPLSGGDDFSSATKSKPKKFIRFGSE